MSGPRTFSVGTSKLIYLSPENHKIGDISEKLKKIHMKNEGFKGSLEAKNGLREFFIEGKLVF